MGKLYEACSACKGRGTVAVAETLPKGPTTCRGCGGRCFVQTGLTMGMVRDVQHDRDRLLVVMACVAEIADPDGRRLAARMVNGRAGEAAEARQRIAVAAESVPKASPGECSHPPERCRMGGEGERAPLRHGSAPTLICDACGGYRLTDRWASGWRPGPVPQDDDEK